MNKEIVQNMFQEVWEAVAYDQKAVLKYFSSNYIQEIDGKIFNRVDFIQHLKVLKDTTKSMWVDIESLQEIGNTVFSNHVMHMLFRDGTIGLIHVIASFRFEGDKIVFCDEITFVEQGHKEAYPDMSHS